MRIVVLFCFVLFVFKGWQAQVSVSIADGNASTCNGTLFDTGGQGGTGYSNNESYTLTICPDNANDVITLDFLNFALSTVSTANPNNSDNLTIYDGNSTAATSLGTYGGNQLQGLIVTCTSLNTSGCLTLVFTSNDQGTGVFAASITCTTPCQRPTVVMTSPTVPQNPLRICNDEQVSFDGSGSFAATGFNIVKYVWNYDDGTVDTTLTPTVNHIFGSGPGEYNVNLYVIDDNNCINSNLETIDVQVGTYPDMSFISSDTLLCVGESVCLEAFPLLMPTTWAALPSSNLGGATYLPDDVGSCFQSELDFGLFNSGQTLTSISELESICINMEHSFMGDLVATIYCPNGQSVIMHQQNGGGTYLGDPIDVDDSLQPGDCWQYCWSPTATNGTWMDNAEFGTTPNVMPSTNGFGNSLIPGTYESLNPLSGLVGCPLNGTWTIEFCDLWGSDDGFICDWNLSFDPNIYPPLTTFTPSIGEDSDSSYWTATAPSSTMITGFSPDLNEVCLTATASGIYEYDYVVTDNHGCTYDTTIFVTVGDGAMIDAGADVTICPGDYQVDATATGGINGLPTCDYTINMFDTFGDGWNGFEIEVVINGVSQGYFTLNTGSTGNDVFAVADGDQIVFNTVSGVFDSEVSYTVSNCSGNVLFQTGVNFTGGAPSIAANVWNTTGVSNAVPQYSFSWTPAAGATSPTDEDPLLNTQVTQTFVVEVWETSHPNCVNTDTIVLTVVNNGYAGEDTTVYFCQSDPTTDLFTLIPGTPDATGNWFLAPAFSAASGMFNPATTASSTLAYVVGTGGCSDTAFVTVNVAVPFVLNLDQDTIICENGTGTISLNPTGGLGAPYTETWTQGLVGNGPHTVQPGISTCYDVFVTDNYGCVSGTETVCVYYNPPLVINVNNTDSICLGDNAILEVAAQGGNSNYNYVWSDQATVVGTASQITVSPTVTTEYCVLVSDGCETTSQTECVEVVIYDMPILAFTSDINSGCYPIDVTFTDGSNSALIQSLVWDFGDGSTTSGLGSVTHTFGAPICYTVSMTATTINNCVSTLTQTDMICPDDYPIADFTFDPNPTDLNQTTVSFIELASTDVVTYFWDFGSNSGLPTGSTPNPVVTYPIDVPDTYEITLTVTNAAGCSDDTTYTLVINDVFSFYVPNTFTPNGDGVNDVFQPKGAAIAEDEYEMLIFDRDGHLIFETNIYGDYWDGKDPSGETYPIGTYVWKIQTKDLYTAERRDFIGHVNIIR